MKALNEKIKKFNFNPIDIKGKLYTQVSDRIRFLSENCDYEIKTDYTFFESSKMWVCVTTLKIYEEDKVRVFTGLAQEIINEGFINKTSALENCETSSVGRACAMAGIGIIDEVASLDEIKKTKQQTQKQELIPETEIWNKAKQAIEQGTASIEQIEKKYYISSENKKLL